MRRKLLIALIILAALITVGVVLFNPIRLALIDSFAECAKAGFPVEQTDPPTCDDGRQTFTGPKGTPLPSMAPVEELEFQVLVEGDSRGTYPAKSQLITSQAQWQNYWLQVHKALSPLPNLIPVDFSKNDVIALNMGPEPTDGYSLSLLSLVSSGQEVTASVQLRQPGQNCGLPPKSTGPYYIALVPKLAASLKFDTATVTHKCSG